VFDDSKSKRTAGRKKVTEHLQAREGQGQLQKPAFRPLGGRPGNRKEEARASCLTRKQLRGRSSPSAAWRGCGGHYSPGKDE